MNELVDVLDGVPIKPCPECKHPFGEHFYREPHEDIGQCEHCARRGARCNVDQRIAWPDLVA